MIYFTRCCKKRRGLHLSAVAFLTTVIFQQMLRNRPNWRIAFASYDRWNVPVGLCLHILSGAFLYHRKWVLGRTSEHVLGSVRFLFERYQASWISQQKVVESASLLKFRGFPIMRTIIAFTAAKSSNGLSRIFFNFFKKCHFACQECSIEGRKNNLV